jgi:hypothetical protein
MTTSGLSTFNLEFTDLAEEAWERCGSELRDGYSLRTTRRSLNLLTIEWANRGINLWTVEQGAIPLVTGQATYDLPNDTIDLLDHVIRTGTGQNQTDINISRISEPTYAVIPNKNALARPIQVWVQRLSGATYPTVGVVNPKIHVWPTPNDPGNQYTFVYWRLRRIQDVGGGTSTQDIPFRFLNCMVAGLAYYMSMKIAGVDANRMMALKMDYEQQLQLAMDEDREKAPVRFIPRIVR